MERFFDLDVTPRELCAAWRRPGRASVLLEGCGDPDEGWAPLVALEAEPVLAWRRRGTRPAPVERLDALLGERRRRGGTSATGLAVLLGFDLLSGSRGAVDDDGAPPDLLALAVDASVRHPPDSPPVLASRADPSELLGRVEAALERAAPPAPAMPPARPAASRPTTSLPREAYLRAVQTVQEHIRRGDIYQANLTQQLRVEFGEDALSLYGRLSDAMPTPRSSFVEVGSVALASVSPESFLRASPAGVVETRPIKGTRPRGPDPRHDAEMARALAESPKDRAELLMIVDLERNDLGRVCRTGSIRVAELGRVRSYPAVHHLVARVQGELREGTGPAELIRATFPGGSVTGAPKRRALEILRLLEPVPRNLYTGSLLWFGDDGSLESSILIRSVVLFGGRAHVGAGGGVVADSDPEGEWNEANHKARRLAEVLGFSPEEAS